MSFPSVSRPLAIAALLALGAGPARGDTPAPVVGETAEFVRPADLVRVFGEEVPGLLGQMPDHYAVLSSSLLASGEAELAPVPFQIDERNAFGYLILDQGPYAETDLDQGRYDSNDECLFFASDAGGEVPAERLEALPNYHGHAEIALTDPVSGATAFAYLVRFTEAAPPSERDDIAYDPQLDRVTSTVYSMGFPVDADGGHASYPDLLSVTPAAGGNGEDVLDRLKIRIEADVLFGLLSFARTEEDFRTRVLAWRDGPIRVVRRIETALHVIFGIYAPPLAVDAIYYRDFVETPNVLDLPISLGTVLSSLEMRVGLDFDRGAQGMRVVSPDNPAVDPIDGVMSASEQELVTGDQSWFLVHGEAGTVMVKMIFGESLPFEQVLDYTDDAEAEDPPETSPGRHEVGRDLRGGLAVEKGRHAYNAFLFVPSHWEAGGEDPYLAMIDHPLQVVVSGPGVVPPTKLVSAAAAEDDGWRRVFEQMRAAIDDIESYEAEMIVYSSIFRGRKLEGKRTYVGKFQKSPRRVYFEIPTIEANFDDPLGEGAQVTYDSEEHLVVGRGAGVRRLFGVVEMAPEHAPTWWWGESVTSLDLWAMAEHWATFLEPGRGRLGHVTIDGERHPQLHFTSTRKAELDLRNPLGTGAADIEIKQVRITLDPSTMLPLKVESFIPGNPAPVSWVEMRELDTTVELERDDFELSSF